MRKLFGCLALLGSLGLAVPAVTSAQDKKDVKGKDKVTKEETTAEDYQNLAKLKDVVGKIAAVDVKAGTMTLTIEWSHMEPNKNFKASNANQKVLQDQQQISRDYDQIMRAKNPVQRQQALTRLQAHLQQLQNASANLQNMFQVVKSSKDFDLEVMDSLKVARANLEVTCDKEGEVIKYTAEELKKMKSADVPGAYTAAPQDLKEGQSVKLYLNPPKSDKKNDQAPDKKDAPAGDATKDAKDVKDKQSAGSVPVALSRVRMVLILEEGNPPDSKDATKKKDKKDNK